jgi:DNA-binding MarR family transcriptional regulator
MTERDTTEFALDSVIHEKARLAVLTYLASSRVSSVPFTELRDELNLTAGNLSVQLRTLEQAGYVEIDKRIVGRKPVTSVSLTERGHTGLREYVRKMEVIIQKLSSPLRPDS